jgi:hypothetical protein
VNLGLVRIGCALLSLAFVLSPVRGGAVDNSCLVESTGVKVQDGRLLVIPDLPNNAVKLSSRVKSTFKITLECIMRQLGLFAWRQSVKC